tara:strand:- start:398 stop:649 length:252 start_codon:yes stop_codon:yes gene_type:complete
VVSDSVSDPQEPWGKVTTAITLAVLNERLETIEEKIDAIHATQARRSDDIELRVRTIERWMYAVPASILTAIVAVVLTITENT